MHPSLSLPLIKVAIVIVVVGVCLTCRTARAQNRWLTFTSPDKTFSVETPAPLRRVASFNGEHGASLSADEKNRWVTCYAVIETSSDHVRFGLNVLKVTKSMRSRLPLWYLSVMLIGDDDNPEPKIQKRLTVNGLTGDEYLFNRENQISPTGSTGEIHTRGRIFVHGDRIYVITFIGRDTKDLTSADAERFLNSFRLLKRRTLAHRRRA